MSAQLAARPNPYQSPLLCEPNSPCCEVDSNPAAPLQVELVLGGRLRRRVRLLGRLSAEIEWNAANAREFVAVNGTKVVSKMVYFRSIPRFCFDMLAGGVTHHVTVDVSIKYVFLIKAFRIVIDDEVVYCEGEEDGLPKLTGRKLLHSFQ